MVLTGHIMLFYTSFGSDQAYSSHLSLHITPISSIISLVIRSIVLFISLKWDALLPSFKSLKLIQGFVCFQNSQLLLEWYSFCEFCIISSMRDIIVLSFGFSISYASLRGNYLITIISDQSSIICTPINLNTIHQSVFIETFYHKFYRLIFTIITFIIFT